MKRRYFYRMPMFRRGLNSTPVFDEYANLWVIYRRGEADVGTVVAEFYNAQASVSAHALLLRAVAAPCPRLALFIALARVKIGAFLLGLPHRFKEPL